MADFIKSREAILLAAIVLLIAAVSIRTPNFIAPNNLASVFNDTAILAVLALGQTAVILTRCIDLSMAANLALCGMLVAMLNAVNPDIPVVALIGLAVAAGALLGAVNGLLVGGIGIPPIVVTLGTLTIYRGLIFILSDGRWINAHEMSGSFKALPRSEWLGIAALSWIALAAIVLMFILLLRTTLGRTFYAVGGNPAAAVYAGIPVGKTQFWAFTIAGALAGLCGYLWVSRYAIAYVNIAQGFELDVIAACVIGGVSIAGGIGTPAGALLGAIFLGVVKNALPVINISPFWQLAITGGAIITAVVLNTKKHSSRIILKTPYDLSAEEKPHA